MEQQFVELGNRIRLRRKALNMKQSELAELLGISNNHMSSIENGKQQPKLDTLIKLCEYLHTTPNHLLLGCMYPNNVSKNVIDIISLCNEEQALLLYEIAKAVYNRNITKI